MVHKSTKTGTELASWQYLLGEILDSERLAALAEDLGMHKTTLERWTQGTTPRNFQRALQDLVFSKHFPEAYRSRFIVEVQKSYPHFQATIDPLLENLPAKEIPSSFYSQVLRSVTFVADPLVFWTVSNTVCQQLYGHLDADESASVGTMLFLFTPPVAPSGNIRSLYAPVRQIGERFSPLSFTFPILIGTESLLTDITSRYHKPLIFSQDILQTLSTPFPQEIKSLALIPLQRRGKTAGIFLATSHKEDYFNSARQKVVYEYALLLSFAFREQDFYPIERVTLAVLPHLPAQQRQEARLPFRMRAEHIREQFEEENAPYQEQLELLALQQLEQVLIEERKRLNHVQ